MCICRESEESFRVLREGGMGKERRLEGEERMEKGEGNNSERFGMRERE